LTIVGEAAKALSDDARNAIDQPWREIIRFRDKGIHGYDGLDPRILCRIATESIPGPVWPSRPALDRRTRKVCISVHAYTDA
jgi:uncharacterized protein with HEPN domain